MTTRSFENLTDTEATAGQAVLASLVGAEDAADVKLLRRLTLDDTGAWFLVVRRVQQPDVPEHRRLILDEQRGPQIKSDLFPVAEACAMLSHGCETLVDEIIAAREQAQTIRKREAAEREEQARKESEERNKWQQELARDRAQYKGAEFERLNTAAASFYMLAMAVKKRDPELAADIRNIAKGLATRDGSDPKLGWPREIWWE